MPRRSGVLGDQRAESANILKKDAVRCLALAKKLREARKDINLSQTVVAHMMGRSQGWLKKVEKDGRVSYVHLERLALIYWKPLDWFFTLDRAEVWDENNNYLGFSEFRWKEKAKLAAARALMRGIIFLPKDLTKSGAYLREHPQHPWRQPESHDDEPWPDE
jgi:transcriptional regulator with XRE-family HTH domain